MGGAAHEVAETRGPTAPERLRQIARWVWRGLFQDKVPLWLHVATVLGTVVATIVLAPIVGHAFEQQKLKATFVIEFLANLDAATGELISEVADLRACRQRAPQSCQAEERAAVVTIAMLRWKALQMDALLTEPEDRAAVDRLYVALNRVEGDLAPRNGAAPGADPNTRAIAAASFELTRRIARRSGVTLRW
ncbi:hypothetical protein [Caulobacter sp.]|uniref:hypothetical protein n=1 Tax=Caulobacter sp. TaxID=78 RepID=UPI003BB2250F